MSDSLENAAELLGVLDLAVQKIRLLLCILNSLSRSLWSLRLADNVVRDGFGSDDVVL